MSATIRQVRVGVSVFIERRGKLLLGLRKGSHGAGTWSVPGGHVDFGEDPATTCARETLEETGLEIINVRPCLGVQYSHSHFREAGKQYVTLYFTADCPVGEPEVMEPAKCGGWVWADAGQLPLPLFEPITQSSIIARYLMTNG